MLPWAGVQRGRGCAGSASHFKPGSLGTLSPRQPIAGGEFAPSTDSRQFLQQIAVEKVSHREADPMRHLANPFGETRADARQGITWVLERMPLPVFVVCHEVRDVNPTPTQRQPAEASTAKSIARPRTEIEGRKTREFTTHLLGEVR